MTTLLLQVYWLRIAVGHSTRIFKHCFIFNRIECSSELLAMRTLCDEYHKDCASHLRSIQDISAWEYPSQKVTILNFNLFWLKKATFYVWTVIGVALSKHHLLIYLKQKIVTKNLSATSLTMLAVLLCETPLLPTSTLLQVVLHQN